MGDGMEPGSQDTDAAEARRIAERREAGIRKATSIRAQRLVDMEAARQLARDTRNDAFGGSKHLGTDAEEVAGVADAVRWLAAEVRCQRVEVADRSALVQELGRPFRTEAEQAEAADIVAAAGDPS